MHFVGEKKNRSKSERSVRTGVCGNTRHIAARSLDTEKVGHGFSVGCIHVALNTYCELLIRSRLLCVAHGKKRKHVRSR